MGVTMCAFSLSPSPPPHLAHAPRTPRLRIDRSKLKWKAKLAGAFDNKVDASTLTSKDKRQARNSKWTLFVLPLVTVLREGLEAVVFVGGVSRAC